MVQECPRDCPNWEQSQRWWREEQRLRTKRLNWCGELMLAWLSPCDMIDKVSGSWFSPAGSARADWRCLVSSMTSTLLPDIEPESSLQCVR